jgi:hypothetical protein
MGREGSQGLQGEQTMPANEEDTNPYTTHPVTPERWSDLERLFGEHGAYSGCWCMFWRVRRRDFQKIRGEGARAGLHELVNRNEVPGVLIYENNEVAGWCSVGPREQFQALEYSRSLKRIDDQPVWSIVCFFVGKPHRKKRLMAALLHGAVEYATREGARIIEGYPLDMQSPMLAGKHLTGYSGYMGIASVFRELGFIEVGHTSEAQLIMRLSVKPA